MFSFGEGQSLYPSSSAFAPLSALPSPCTQLLSPRPASLVPASLACLHASVTLGRCHCPVKTSLRYLLQRGPVAHSGRPQKAGTLPKSSPDCSPHGPLLEKPRGCRGPAGRQKRPGVPLVPISPGTPVPWAASLRALLGAPPNPEPQKCPPSHQRPRRMFSPGWHWGRGL